MVTVPFLTDVDPQAAIKGSRDLLGVQTIWARLGRNVIGNLTPVTTSVATECDLFKYHLTGKDRE